MSNFEELIASLGHPDDSARRFQVEVMSQPMQQQEESYRLSEEDIEELSNAPIEPPQEQQVVGIIAVQQYEEDNSEPEDADAEEVDGENSEEEDAVSAEQAFSSELADLQAERENNLAQEALADNPEGEIEFHRHMMDNGVEIVTVPTSEIDEYIAPISAAVGEFVEREVRSGNISTEQAIEALSNGVVDLGVETTDDSLLTPNSPSLLLEEATSRFSGAEWFEKIKQSNVIIAGLGGIGSWTALLLGRMVPERLTLYDDDVVEVGNMSGQLYGWSSNNQPKARALSNMIRDYTATYNCFFVKDKFTEDSTPGPIMICGFDNMSARKTFFRSWKRHVDIVPESLRDTCLYIDGRLSFDTLQVFCIQGDDNYNIERYRREFLFDDSQADETICSMKQTSYMAAMIGSVIVNLFTNFMANSCNPDARYDLPFFTEYDSQNMLFKTEY